MRVVPAPRKQIKARLAETLRAHARQSPPPSGLLSFSLPVADLDLVDWVSAQPLFPKVFWQARGDDRRYAGVGAAAMFNGGDDPAAPWSELMAFTEKHPGAALFGGMRFDPHRPPAPEWRDFERLAFFLPRFLVEQDDTATTLHCSVPASPGLAPETWLAVAMEQVDRLACEVPHLDGSRAMHGVVNDVQSRADWMQSVRRLTGMMACEEMQKAVLVRRMDVTFPRPVSPFVFIRDFHAMGSPAYYFCLQFAADSAFVGSSPECLFARSGRDVFSEALAGTRPRGKTDAEDARLRADLLDSPKEGREHRLVHDHVRAALAPLCTTLTSDETAAVCQLMLVQHLLQTTRGVLKPEVSDGRLVDALHPTPAVGGVPTAAALEQIRTLEPFDRGWYAAPVGIVRHDAVELAVAIRSGLLHGQTLSLYCGAGIVGDSDPISEWEETESKLGNFLHVIHVE